MISTTYGDLGDGDMELRVEVKNIDVQMNKIHKTLNNWTM